MLFRSERSGGAEVDDTQVRALADFLHQLGTIRWYSSDARLRGTVFLKPLWLIDAMKTVVSNKSQKWDNEMRTLYSGRMPHAELHDLWKRAGMVEEASPGVETELLISVMYQFDLAYPWTSGSAAAAAAGGGGGGGGGGRGSSRRSRGRETHVI